MKGSVVAGSRSRHALAMAGIRSITGNSRGSATTSCGSRLSAIVSASVAM